MAVRLITVAETPLFIRQAATIWDDDEHSEFVIFIAANPEAGDVVPDTAGCERFVGHGKVRANEVAFALSTSTTTPIGRFIC
jgi:hypothetical protein